jgi:AraC family transcriptional regulator, regulatory protein of adaptative response / DNA-3-methyladenine glycosylase II
VVHELDLPCRPPFDGAALIAFLGARAVAGVEEVEGTTYRRSLRLGHGCAVVELTPGPSGVRCVLRLDDLRDRAAAVARCRRLLDLDAEPQAIAAKLGADALLGPLVRSRPGLRVPGCVDGFEIAVRAIVGQQVSVPAARTILGRMAARHGGPLAEPSGAVTHRFPAARELAAVDPAELPFPRARGEALREVARLVEAGELELDQGADPETAVATLLGVRGIGPWTASYVAMRALADRDAFPVGDVGIRHALARLGHGDGDPRALAEAWRPWRSYAVMHLWRSLDPVTRR